MPPANGSVKEDPVAFEQSGITGRNKVRENGISYTSPGGGEVYRDGTASGFVRSIYEYLVDEHHRPSYSSTMIRGPDLHTRPPAWLEDKNTAIDGSPLTSVERNAPGYWSTVYKKELEVAEAIQEVKRQRRYEQDNDLVGFINRARRYFGLSPQLDEAAARSQVESRYRLEDEARRLRASTAPGASDDEVAQGEEDCDTSSSPHPIGTLPRNGTAQLLANVPQQRRSEHGENGVRHTGGALTAPWLALMESIETGRPLTRVANEYRPRVDYYGLDPFLDSAPSVVWFSTKCGIAIGLAHGTAKAVQAMNVDVQFLKASGVGVLSILNMSVFASVVKWGGNMTIFACAFCVGDRLMRWIKSRMLPSHDAQCRSTSNYVMGLSFSGAMVGVLPWWVLNDTGLAMRMAASGLAVGGALGLMVGLSVQHLVALNTARLDANNRQLRRYEALLARQREWAEQVRSKYTSSAYVWW
ncbi:conserved hypothetical protein [Leishmania major strain Friedlin]|uniref:Transmembrane protein n=1 Tax=Leishmania major TaxID=5664 RepID=Q4QAG1_LEIMA|nr:conserved hypothetical protein [Leishmania major strain Friedlin]CAG9574643.1 hypothetical_protein_-_conserved [Leishmania major strain Friedlin]CAJ05194.1 conserved hypothetical protein [Leishmania major strain Friedlin]|eukprot:XP_001683687.1 conserved hypothetical protein [Leishmania major strain Friedlin]